MGSGFVSHLKLRVPSKLWPSGLIAHLGQALIGSRENKRYEWLDLFGDCTVQSHKLWVSSAVKRGRCCVSAGGRIVLGKRRAVSPGAESKALSQHPRLPYD